MTEQMENPAQPLDVSMVDSSGLFDRDWYLETYPEVAEDPLTHFCRDGWRNGLQANPYFDTAWYSKTYGGEFLPDENPLLHYIRRGERENAWPSPHLDPEWYRDEYALNEGESPLQHYLVNRTAGIYSPLPGFDVAAYVENNPAWLETEQDPYLHSLQRQTEELDPAPPSESPIGAVLNLVGGSLEPETYPDVVPWEALKEALRLFIPHIPFDEEWYCRHYPDVDAAVKCGLMPSAHAHFIDYGFFEGRSPAPRDYWMAT